MFLDSLNIDQPDHWLVSWGFSGQEFEELKEYVEEEEYPAGAIIFNEDEESDSMYLVLEGMVLVFRTDEEGTEHTISIVTEGQSFGELGLLIGQKRFASVAAGLDVKLLKITPEILRALEEERPEIAMRMYKMLAQTLSEQWMRVGPWVEQLRKNTD